MTWTKLPDDFGDDCARAGLTDTEFRVHVEATIWCMRRETGGAIDKIDIRRGIEVADPWAAIDHLVDLGWWEQLGPCRWQIHHTMDSQVEPEVLAKRRKTDADRQRKRRRKQAGLDDVTP
jgi:hypothetical protein